MKTGIVIFAHGSRIESANDAVRAVAEAAGRAGGLDLVEVAFLDFQPDLDHAIERLVGEGAKRVLVVPYFLTMGLHLHRDLPDIVAELSGRHAGVEIRVSPPLDGHPALAGILMDRAREALQEWDSEPRRGGRN